MERLNGVLRFAGPPGQRDPKRHWDGPLGQTLVYDLLRQGQPRPLWLALTFPHHQRVEEANPKHSLLPIRLRRPVSSYSVHRSHDASLKATIMSLTLTLGLLTDRPRDITPHAISSVRRTVLRKDKSLPEHRSILHSPFTRYPLQRE